MSFYGVCRKLLSRIILKVNRITVVNPENEPEGGALVCSNHLAASDPVIIGASLKRQVSFMAKKELFRIPVLSLIIRALGAFPVNRGNIDIVSVKHSIKLLGEGNMVGIFPQGTRQNGKYLRDTSPKSGVGMILARSDADVLPVAIITKDNDRKKHNKVYIVLGQKIPHEELAIKEKSREEFDRVTSLVFGRICDLYDEYAYLAEENDKK